MTLIQHCPHCNEHDGFKAEASDENSLDFNSHCFYCKEEITQEVIAEFQASIHDEMMNNFLDKIYETNKDRSLHTN